LKTRDESERRREASKFADTFSQEIDTLLSGDFQIESFEVKNICNISFSNRSLSRGTESAFTFIQKA
jgi:hypothetical protein